MSITDTDKLRVRVATLDKLLDDFDGQLDDLLVKSLPETLLGLDTLQQAKLQVTVPYLVYDLIIIYLKTKGIDPKTHPVFRELERVKGYIEKVSKAEKQESEQQRMAIDKAAANRFIKNAIAQAVRPQDQSSRPTGQEPTPGSSMIQAQPIPADAAKKMLARAEWEKQVQEAVEKGEEDLEVFDEAEDYANVYVDVKTTNDKTSAPASLPVGNGETDTSPEQRSATTKKKKKKSKKAKLPLTGGEGAFSENPQGPPPQPEIHTTVHPTPEITSARVNNKKRPSPASETPTGNPDASVSVSAAVSAPPKSKKRKRNKKSPTAAGTEGITSRSQSQSQSREVSTVSTPQTTTLQLPGVETDAAVAGAVEKPKKWRKCNRKKKGSNIRSTAVEAGAQS